MKTSVYLMGNVSAGAFKIGISSNPVRRMRAMNVPFKMDLIRTLEANTRSRAQQIEKSLHIAFKSNHLHGEWFFGINKKDFEKALIEHAVWELVADDAKKTTRYYSRANGFAIPQRITLADCKKDARRLPA